MKCEKNQDIFGATLNLVRSVLWGCVAGEKGQLGSACRKPAFTEADFC